MKRKGKPDTAVRPIHARIAELRDRKGLTQAELADLCGVLKSAVSHWERGVSAPTGKRLQRVATALGVSVGYLFREAA